MPAKDLQMDELRREPASGIATPGPRGAAN